jgi:hypothetical protein
MTLYKNLPAPERGPLSPKRYAPPSSRVQVRVQVQCRVYGVGFRVQNVAFRVKGLEFKV